MFDFRNLILSLPIILISLSVHEFSHAKAADMLGDKTARFNGRLTLDIRAHIDPIGLLVLIVTQRIGWAKPVPVNPYNFTNPRKGMMLVGLAGPVSNFCLAILTALGIHLWKFFDPDIIWKFSVQFSYPQTYVYLNSFTFNLFNLLILMVLINIGLGIFNLLPIPPLDGSKIIGGILPSKYSYIIDFLEGPTGMIIVLLLAVTGAFGVILEPLIDFAFSLLGL